MKKYIILNEIVYIPFTPYKNYKSIKNTKYFYDTLKKIQPDLVHIHGTEMYHSRAMVNVCEQLNIKFVVSIQGLLSIISHHLYSGLDNDVIHGSTLRNLRKQDNIYNLHSIFKSRGVIENQVIKLSNYVIGRTYWDKICVEEVNPKAVYFHCNEILRESFYKDQWSINNCEKYSIFVSQAQYPIKGLHFLLKALPIVLKKFPKTKLYVAGKNITSSNSIKDWFLRTYYGYFLKKLIRKYNLENIVHFTGPLVEEEMKKRLLKTHVFVSPSTIENESNSLSEAKILGVPSIASYVGGVIDRVDQNKDGFLYQHDAFYVLAHYINKIFSDDDLAVKFSLNSRKNALKFFNKNTNIQDLVSSYKKIIEK